MPQRILFVDDEPRILDGLQRMLRPLREEWDMAFVGGGVEALERLAQAPFDVVVSDMRMPGMDGAQLLSEVRSRYPEVVRIGLSGQTDRETVLRAVEPTHQYLAKPCDPEILKATVARIRALRERLTDPTLRGLVSGMKALPSLPSLFLAVVEELKSPGASLQKVSQLIATDIGMTAKLLQLVNSAFFGLRYRVDNLTQAMSLLSFDTIRSLMLSFHVFSQCDQARLNNPSLPTLSEHSFTTGICARSIAQAENQEQRVLDTTFTAGLLHDCGTLVLMTNLPEYYVKAFALARAQRLPLWEAERETFGVTHAEVGAYLLGIWGLPDTLVETLAFHHRPGSCLEQTFGPLTAVHVADVLEHEADTADMQPAPTSIDLAYLTTLGVADRLPVWRERSRAALQTEGGNDRENPGMFPIC